MSTLALSDDRFVPIYVRIQERIRAAIAEGTLAPGDRVWSEAELASEFRTTRSTVRHALDRLVFEGLIVRQVGRGSFVAERGIFHSPIDSRHCLSFDDHDGVSELTQPARDGRSRRPCADHADGRVEASVHAAK